MIIGVSGKKRHGKGTVAGILVREYGFTQLDFADALRGDMAVINPIVGEIYSGFGHIEEIRYNEAIEQFGYEQAKELYPEIVRLLQVYGTEVGRDRIGPQHWVNRWQDSLWEMGPRTNVVASDVRFQSEVAAINVQRFEGYGEPHFVGVRRPGYTHDVEADKHTSEQLPELPDDRCTIIEASSVESLTEQVHIVMARLGFERHTNQERQ